MSNPLPPKDLYLYWYVQDNGTGFFTVQAYKAEGARYVLVSKIQPDWGRIEFDETGMAIDALTGVMGEKQAEVTAIKAKIQELLCIGHDIQG